MRLLAVYAAPACTASVMSTVLSQSPCAWRLLSMATIARRLPAGYLKGSPSLSEHISQYLLLHFTMNSASQIPISSWDFSLSLSPQIPTLPFTDLGDKIQTPAEYYWSENSTTILSYIGNGPYVAVNSSCYMSESCFLLQLAIKSVG